MEITGKIKAITNERNGVSQSTGKEWFALELVVTTASGIGKNTGNPWENNIKFDCFGDIAKAVKEYRNVGDDIKVTFDIRADEWNGRWYNKLSPFSVEAAGNNSTSEPAPKTHEAEQEVSQDNDPFGGSQDKDKLPF